MLETAQTRSINHRVARWARETSLVRDPMDTLISVLAFHAKHRVAGSGGKSVETDQQLADVIRADMLSLVPMWKCTSHRGTLVRYLELICSPTEQIRATLDALGWTRRRISSAQR